MEIGLDLANDLRVATALRDLAADAVPIRQRVVGIGEVVARSYGHVDQIRHRVATRRWRMRESNCAKESRRDQRCNPERPQVVRDTITLDRSSHWVKP